MYFKVLRVVNRPDFTSISQWNCLKEKQKKRKNKKALCQNLGDITLPTKVRLVKAMVFPVVMYGCENWTVKKAECRRIDAFELWCRRRLFRVPLIARRSNQQMDFTMFCIYAFKSLKSIFVFDPVILTLIKLQKNSLDKTSQIWNFALTISFSTACNLCIKQGKNIEVFTFPRKIWDLLNLGQHSFILFMK